MPRPCSGIDWPDWVPGRMSTSSMPSSVSSGTFVPRARRRHRDGDRAVQVVAAPLERGVREFVDLDVEVTGGTAAGPDLALAGELDPRAVVDTGRDLHRQGPAGADAPVARALRARRRDHGAEALALRAGPGRHDLAQEGPGDLRHLTAAAAHVTRLRGGAGRRALAAAGVADDGRVDLDVLRRAEGRLVEFDLDPDHRVLAAAGARARTALRRRTEERVHDVREVPEAAGAEAARAAACRPARAGRRRGRRPASSAGPTAPRKRR